MVIKNRTRYDNIGLDQLIITKDNEDLIKYLKNYRDNIEEYINNNCNVIILGTVGSGKSFITKSFQSDIDKIVVEKEKDLWAPDKGKYAITVKDNIRTKYIDVANLIKELRSDFVGKTADRDLFQCDILFIDEIGVQYGTDAERQTLFDLINYRYNCFKPTFLISNHPLNSTDTTKGLKAILGQRILDRIQNKSCRIFTLKDSSIRNKYI